MVKKYKGSITYIADTVEDLNASKAKYNLGDKCLIAATGDHYIANSEGEWAIDPEFAAASGEVKVYTITEEEKANMAAEVKAEVKAEAEQDIIKVQNEVNELLERTPYDGNGRFGCKILVSDNVSILEKFMTLDCGLYTLYAQKGVVDCPEGAIEDSSFRGLMHITNHTARYGWILLMDKANNVFLRHIYRGEAGPWEKLVKESRIAELEARVAALENK